jgi:uncharacterized protein (DUF1499 family)
MILYIVLGIIGLLVILVVGGLVVARMQTPGRDAVAHGVENGRLSPCPDTPNCVSTMENDDEHSVPPIAISVSGDDVMRRAKDVLLSLPRTELIEERANYLRAESRSALFRFIDDVEVYVPEGESVLHFRSASRVGKSDMGVNKKRYEQFKAGLQEQ